MQQKFTLKVPEILI